MLRSVFRSTVRPELVVALQRRLQPGSAIAVTGPPGVGKTHLIDAAIGRDNMHIFDVMPGTRQHDLVNQVKARTTWHFVRRPTIVLRPYENVHIGAAVDILMDLKFTVVVDACQFDQMDRNIARINVGEMSRAQISAIVPYAVSDATFSLLGGVPALYSDDPKLITDQIKWAVGRVRDMRRRFPETTEFLARFKREKRVHSWHAPTHVKIDHLFHYDGGYYVPNTPVVCLALLGTTDQLDNLIYQPILQRLYTY